MAKQKNNAQTPKKPRIEAPQVEPQQTDDKKTIKVIDVTKFEEQVRNSNISGLDANHRVDLLKVNHEIFGKPDAKEKFGESTVEAMNEITAVMAIAETVTEVVKGNSAFSLTVRKAYLPQLANVANAMGVTIDQKLLPAQTATEEVTIPAEAVKPSKETKEQIKEDIKTNDNAPELDPTKIATDEDLKKALTYILGETMSPAQNMSKAVEFYRAVKSLEASKTDNKDENIKAVKEMSFDVILKNVFGLVEKVPYVTIKIADNMRTVTGCTKSIVPAFCTMRDAVKNRKTGIPMCDDKTIADIVKVLVTYSAEKQIEKYEENLTVLHTDDEKNKVAIEGAENSIKYLNNVIAMANMPSAETIEKLLNAYDNKEDRDNWKVAHRIFSNVAKTYYGSVDLSRAKKDVLDHNVKEYIGIITNMFRDPLTQIPDYSEANITELEFIDDESKKA